MSRRKKSDHAPPVGPQEDWPRDTGTFEPVSAEEAQEFTLAQVRGAKQIAERLVLAEAFCKQAEDWINGTAAGNKSEGVAKSVLRDALVLIAEVWLGKPGPEVLALVRRFIAEAKQAGGITP